MIDLLSNFDAFTMAVLVAALYFSLSSVLVYTYLYRRTYPGFGSMTLGLVCWSVGLFLNYFRPFDLLLSLYIGGVLMLLSGVFLFRGLLLYGGGQAEASHGSELWCFCGYFSRNSLLHVC